MRQRKILIILYPEFCKKGRKKIRNDVKLIFNEVLIQLIGPKFIKFTPSFIKIQPIVTVSGTHRQTDKMWRSHSLGATVSQTVTIKWHFVQ